MENSRQHLLLRTDILQKIVVGCPCEMMIFYLNYQLFTAHRSVGLQFLLWKALDVYNPKAGQDKYQNLNSRKRGFHSHPSGGEQRSRLCTCWHIHISCWVCFNWMPKIAKSTTYLWVKEELCFTAWNNMWNITVLYFKPGGGALPYITYTGMCRTKGSWFEAPDLERGIHFRGVF